MSDDDTLQFYADNAATYAQHAAGRATPELDAFLAKLRPGAAILELGTGGGHDAAHMLARGFDVTPTDASVGLAEEAGRLIGRPVRLMAFHQLEDIAAYDAVWACAALLHAPRAELTADFTRIHRALRPGGLLTASFKAGDAEGRDRFGRYYNYLSAETLAAHLHASGDWPEAEITAVDGGGYDGLPTRWLWLNARRS